MSFRLGLTGSIGMGKSTASGIFRKLGHPVWDADAAVHQIYAPNGAAVGPVTAEFPAARGTDGEIDRQALKGLLAQNPAALQRLEAIVHPLVAADRNAFVAANRDAPVVVLDIPLLFENGLEQEMDGVAVVSAPEEVQRARVLARPGMTADTLEVILSRQMPDAEKRRRASWIIPALTLEGAEATIMDILAEIMAEKPHA